jgi:hypothetical protein
VTTAVETQIIQRKVLLRGTADAGVRRFTVAVVAGVATVLIPYIWVLCDLWNSSPSLLRTAESDRYASNFYDLQARAMFHGHLSIANGALGGEAFIHDGRQYTYFGIFPSLLRMPVLLLTQSLDGRLTAPSMLLAWLVTAAFSSLLVWRVRLLVRGRAALSWTEAGSYGVLLATIMGGSVLIYLASDPDVFHEDLAWSVALTVASTFALLGVLERPSWRRVILSGALVLAANLDRASTGYACVIGGVLVAIWFATGRGGGDNRRWSGPILIIAALVPIFLGCVISYVKFGVLFGLPTSDQLFVYSQLSHVNGGHYFGPEYLPSALLAYLRPDGLRLTSFFPFLELPPIPFQGIGGVALDGTDRVASVPSSMPLLFLSGLWGFISAFRPKPAGRSVILRLLLVSTALGGCTVLIYGWIEYRFTADFLPFLVLAGAVGMVDVWRRFEARGPRDRYFLLTGVTIIGVFSIAANLGIASSFQSTWSSVQALHYVSFQKTISDATGNPLAGNIVRGTTLPSSAPAEQLFVAGNCAALYISEGFAFPRSNNASVEAFLQGGSWRPVELGPDVQHTLDISLNGPVTDLGPGVSLVTVGTKSASTISVQPYGSGEVRFTLKDPDDSRAGPPVRIPSSRTYRITIVTDPYRHLVSVTSQQGAALLTGILSNTGPIVVHEDHSNVTARRGLTVAESNAPPQTMALCRSLP